MSDPIFANGADPVSAAAGLSTATSSPCYACGTSPASNVFSEPAPHILGERRVRAAVTLPTTTMPDGTGLLRNGALQTPNSPGYAAVLLCDACNAGVQSSDPHQHRAVRRQFHATSSRLGLT